MVLNPYFFPILPGSKVLTLCELADNAGAGMALNGQEARAGENADAC